MKQVLIFFLLFIFNFSLSIAALVEKKPYRVYLKPGAVITRLSDDSSVVITKGTYVNALETNPNKREMFMIYDKTGKPVYEATAYAITEIEQELQILPNVDANVIYPAPSTHQGHDKVASLDTQFNLHFDNLQTSAFSSIYNLSPSSALGSRYEVRTLYHSDLPVNFGVGFNYQTATWSDDVDGNVTLNVLSFGPQIERLLYTEENLFVSLFAGAEFAPFYQTSSAEFSEEYQAMLFDIGAEALWDTRFGKWSLGTHFRHHDLTLNSTTKTTINPIPESITLNSIGVMVGYKYEWNL